MMRLNFRKLYRLIVLLLVVPSPLVLNGCAVLTKSQVAEVKKFAQATDDYDDLPGAVIEGHARLHRARQLLAASSLTDGQNVLTQTEQARATDASLQQLAGRADAALDVLDEYAKLLKVLTSDKFANDLGESAESLGTSLDSAVKAYNSAYGTQVQSFGGLVASIVRGVGGIYIKHKQSKALQTAVANGDGVIAEMTAAVENLLKAYLPKPAGSGEEYIKADVAELKQFYAGIADTAAGHLPLATVVTVADALDGADQSELLAKRSLAAVQALRTAHAKLLEKTKTKLTLTEAISEVRSYVDEVKAAQKLKKKLDAN